MASLVKVVHRFIRQGERKGSLGGSGIQEASEPVWVNPDHVVRVSQDGDRFLLLLSAGHEQLAINKEDFERLGSAMGMGLDFGGKR